MVSRMDKYKDEFEEKAITTTRSDKNKELYKQVYNAYDEFENLVVPDNAKEIDLSDLKKEITSRDQYRTVKEYSDVTNNKIVRKEKIVLKQKQENEIYDIKELLNKAVTEKKEPELIQSTLSNGDYLKKLKLDNTRTNIEQVKEIYDDIKEEVLEEEDESLLRTANLSLEILSDLKSDNDSTMINPPIKDEEMPEDVKDMDFYSNTYKFSKKDFDDKQLSDEETDDSGNGKFFFKILLLILGIILVIVIMVYLISYFNRV